MTEAFDVRLFGAVEITYARGGATLGIVLPKGAKAILAWLMLNRGVVSSRETVAFTLWPDEPEQSAFANLRRHIYLLTRKFSEVLPSEKCILADHRSLSWNQAAPLNLDIDEFRRLCGVPNSGARLAEVYRGDLAADLGDEWLTAYRIKFREEFVDACLRSAQFFSSAGDAPAAVKMLAASLREDPWREDVVRSMILVRARSGDRAGALSQFESFRESLLKEIGAHPTHELIAAVDSIRHDRYDDPFEGAPAETVTPSKQPRLVPDAMRSRYFLGRGDLLGKIRLQLANRGRSVLSGLGGIGKTQTALEYVARYGKEYPAGVFWVNAESASTLTTGFVQIGKALGLPESAHENHQQTVRAVVRWLTENEGWLLVLDNAEDREVLPSFVPEAAVGNVLITSRERVFQELGVPRGLDVPDLPATESLHFLLLRTGREAAGRVELAAASELAAELGHLPLALEQAAAYIAETDATFVDYLAAFRKRRVEVLERASPLLSRSTVAVTWAANFAAVQASSPASADVLKVCAFIGPESIPFELVSQGAPALGAPISTAVVAHGDLAVAELLRPLARYSLVRSDPNSRTFGVHQLVQEMVRGDIGEVDRCEYVDRAVAALDATFPDVEFSVWDRCDRLAPHVIAVEKWIDSARTAAKPSFRVLSCLGRYRVDRGRYAEARPLFEQAVSIAEQRFAPGNSELAAGLNNLALVAVRGGQYTEARELLSRAIEICEGRGPDDATIATSLTGLGNIHLDLGQYAEAEPLLRQALAVRERILGPQARETAESLHALATALSQLHRYAEAEALERRALACCEGRLGVEHTTVTRSLAGLAAIRLKLGDHDEARFLYERVAKALEESHGADHHRLAEVLEGLAHLDSGQARHEEARRNYRRALAIRERALGEHPDVARSLVELASFEAQQENRVEAIRLLGHAQQMLERHFGTTSVEVSEVRNRIKKIRDGEAADSAASA